MVAQVDSTLFNKSEWVMAYSMAYQIMLLEWPPSLTPKPGTSNQPTRQFPTAASLAWLCIPPNPRAIRTFLVDPVGLAEGERADIQTGLVRGPQGTLFSRDKHCLPDIVTTLWNARDEAKRARNQPLSQALK